MGTTLRPPRLAPRQTDYAVTAVLLLWALPNVPWWWRHPHGHHYATSIVLVSLFIALAQSIPFLWRRVIPVRIALLMIAIIGVRSRWDVDLSSSTVSLLAAAYGVGAYSSFARRSSRLLGVLCLVGAALVAFVVHERNTGLPLALLGAALFGGESLAARRAETRAAIASAESAERTRIARELHDVLAHQLSAIAVQAGSARMAWQTSGSLAGTDPGEVLGTVEQLAREALGELGHLLGALRKDQDDVLARRPAPGLRDLDGLLEAGRASGLDLSLSVEGPVRALPSGVDLAAYRIVQESVTNAARHAPGAVARIAVRFEDEEVQVDVVNGPAALAASGGSWPAAAPGFGRGLMGMRERAALHGGCLDAGSRPDGGFAVSARLPAGGSGGGDR